MPEGGAQSKGKDQDYIRNKKNTTKSPSFHKVSFSLFQYSLLKAVLQYPQKYCSRPTPISYLGKINKSTAESKQAKHWPGF